MQRIASSASSSSSAPTTSSISSPRERVQRLGPVHQHDADRSFALDDDEAHLSPLQERAHRGLRLLAEHRHREPVARVRRRLVPRELAPDVELRLRVARRLRQLARERLDPAVDDGVELGGAARRRSRAPTRPRARAGISSQSRMISRARRSPTISVSHCVAPPAGTEPCSRPTCRMYASSTITERSHAICSSLPPPTQIPLMRAIVGLPISSSASCMPLERAEPLPVLLRVAEQTLAPRAKVGADAERAALARDDEHADLVVPRDVLARARELAQHPEVERVQYLRPVQRDRRARRRLLVDDRLEAELVRAQRARRRRLAHARSANMTVKRPAHLHRVLAGRHELVAARRRLERVACPGTPTRRSSAYFGSPIGAPKTGPCRNVAPGTFRQRSACALVALGIGRVVVENKCSDHARERIACRRKGGEMGKKIVHVEFPAQDADRAEKFWEGFGGWTIGDSGMEGIRLPDVPGRRLGRRRSTRSRRASRARSSTSTATTSTPTSRRCASWAARPRTSSRSRTSAGSRAARTPKAIRSASSSRTSRSRRRSNVTALAVALVVAGGIGGAVQAALMGRWGERVGTLEAFAFATLLTALIGAAVLLVGRGSLAGYASAARAPVWLWTAAAMSALIVVGLTYAAPRLGTTAAVGIVVAGNLAMGVVIDRFGLFGLERIPLGWERILGVVLLTLGAALSLAAVARVRRAGGRRPPAPPHEQAVSLRREVAERVARVCERAGRTAARTRRASRRGADRAPVEDSGRCRERRHLPRPFAAGTRRARPQREARRRGTRARSRADERRPRRAARDPRSGFPTKGTEAPALRTPSPSTASLSTVSWTQQPARGRTRISEDDHEQVAHRAAIAPVRDVRIETHERSHPRGGGTRPRRG